MPYHFTTPTTEIGPVGTNSRLWEFYTYDLGITVLKFGNDYIEVLYPTEDDLAEADIAWTGGHIHTVSDAEAASLTSAGYGEYLTEIV